MVIYTLGWVSCVEERGAGEVEVGGKLQIASKLRVLS